MGDPFTCRRFFAAFCDGRVLFSCRFLQQRGSRSRSSRVHRRFFGHTSRFSARRIRELREAGSWYEDAFGTTHRAMCRALPHKQEHPAPSPWRGATREYIPEVQDPQQSLWPWQMSRNAQMAECFSLILRECLMLAAWRPPLQPANRARSRKRRTHRIFQILDFRQSANKSVGDGTTSIPQNLE